MGEVEAIREEILEETDQPLADVAMAWQTLSMEQRWEVLREILPAVIVRRSERKQMPPAARTWVLWSGSELPALASRENPLPLAPVAWPGDGDDGAGQIA
jgi:hypothetical protein